MTNKPFNLERALAGDPVITRDDRHVTELHHFSTIRERDDNVVYTTFGEYIYRVDLNGRYLKEKESENDLFMAPKTKTYYVNVYRNEVGNVYTGCVKQSEEESVTERLEPTVNDFIKTISFEVDT